LIRFREMLTKLMQDFVDSPAFRYAQGVQRGDYQDRPIFTELVDAMVQLREREERGVGLQNFRYGHALSRWAEECFILSPKVYGTLRKALPLRTARNAR
jgi:hypothetical protein